MSYRVLTYTSIFLLSTLGLSNHVFAKGNVIIVKAGTYTIDTTAQRIDSFPTVNASFDEDGGTYGVEYDHVFGNGISIGGGYQRFNLDYTSNAGSGDVDASFIMFNGKYYFLNSDFKPFIGASAGFAVTDFNGGITGNTVGFATAVMVGIRYQFSLVGIYAEYKNYLTADTEDSLDAEVDLAGDSVTAGLSFEF